MTFLTEKFILNYKKKKLNIINALAAPIEHHRWFSFLTEINLNKMFDIMSVWHWIFSGLFSAPVFNC